MILLGIRYMLASENKRRDAEGPDNTYDDVYIDVVLENGEKVTRKVDKASCQLTILAGAD